MQIARDELISRDVPVPSLVETPVADTTPAQSRGRVICLTRFSTPTEAHILCARLAAEGIATVAGDANLLQANWLWTQAIGGVRVLIHEVDLVRAREILQTFQRGDFALAEDEPA
ncbi:hypothetical protein DVJ77_05545 [Dyella tabacisoli]|uniref:DUF2007 domain-containing protein n=2 Tax=Dyella tabacisoli TaxID=2282381 RepID=A0A369UQX3_9GAMM|nr:hypothetical protein DVJ77_05545 [Dyella tabacisoli]